ncbi:MAG: hypothetical protein ACLPV8_16610, partial [Steroidobacteraceae bacterium]
QLRAARSKIFQARQLKQQQWTRDRDSVVAEAHAAAQRQVEEAKSALQVQTNASRQTIEDSIDQLAGEILAAVLPKSRAAVGRVR